MAKTLAEKIAVMQAAALSEEIECRYLWEESWQSVSTPTRNWDRFDYRVKPKPQKFWVIFNEQNRIIYVGESKPNANLYKNCSVEEYERPSK